MRFETLEDDDCVISKASMDYFEDLIKFRKDNEQLWQKWCKKK